MKNKREIIIKPTKPIINKNISILERKNSPESIYFLMKDKYKYSTCFRRQVCAILTDKDYNILAIETNQAYKSFCNQPRGCLRSRSKSGEDLHKCRAIHAEVNCIFSYLDNRGPNQPDIKDTIIWISHRPCNNCFAVIANIGIKEIHYYEHYGIPSIYSHVDRDAEDLNIKLINHYFG